MDLKDIRINARNWIDSAQDGDYLRALVNAVFNLRVQYAMELVRNDTQCRLYNVIAPERKNFMKVC